MAIPFLQFLIRTGFAVFSCLIIVQHGLKKKSLDVTGAIASVVVGFLLTLSNLCFFASCATFFLTSSKLTRFKSDVKEKIEDEFKKGWYQKSSLSVLSGDKWVFRNELVINPSQYYCEIATHYLFTFLENSFSLSKLIGRF